MQDKKWKCIDCKEEFETTLLGSWNAKLHNDSHELEFK